MNTSSASSDVVLRDLTAWRKLAHDILVSSRSESDSDRMRSLKHELLDQHHRHLSELRVWLGQRAADADLVSTRLDAWAEVTTAMKATDERVALAACALLQRAVLAAYDRVSGLAWMNPEAMQLVQRHKLELKECYARTLTNQTGWRDRVARTGEIRPELTEALAH